jgi:hypothetical protein
VGLWVGIDTGWVTGVSPILMINVYSAIL